MYSQKPTENMDTTTTTEERYSDDEEDDDGHEGKLQMVCIKVLKLSIFNAQLSIKSQDNVYVFENW